MSGSGEADAGSAERGYRRLLALYPEEHRRAHEAGLLGVLMTGARAGPCPARGRALRAEGHGLRPTPPHSAAGLVASASVSGRHCWTRTRPGSTSSSPLKKRRTSSWPRKVTFSAIS